MKSTVIMGKYRVQFQITVNAFLGLNATQTTCIATPALPWKRLAYIFSPILASAFHVDLTQYLEEDK